MDKNLLKGEIRAKAMSQADVAGKIGISLSRFNAKLNGTNGAEFTLSEVIAIKQVLNLTFDKTDSIFFK